ncbi:MAG: DUF4157 domain-containing protein [Myxococcota bacterium]
MDVARSDAHEERPKNDAADAPAAAASLPASPAEAQGARAQDAGGNQAVIHRKASGEGGGDAGRSYGDATSGGGGELPHRGAMEGAFGVDLGGVRAHTGKSDEMSAMGARAATDGSSVAFADAQPGKELVAHEVAHVVQNRQAGGGGGVQKKSTVSDPGSSAEREADSVAPAAARGEKVSVREAPSAGIHREELPGGGGGTPPAGGGATPPAGGGATPPAGGGATPGAGGSPGAGTGATPGPSRDEQIAEAVKNGDAAQLMTLVTTPAEAGTVARQLQTANKAEALVALGTGAQAALWAEPCIVAAASTFNGGTMWLLTRGSPERRRLAVREAVAQSKAPQLLGTLTSDSGNDWASDISDAQYLALLGMLGQPVGNNLFLAIWQAYGDGTTPARSAACARATWTALFTARILAPGDKDAWWPAATPAPNAGSTFEARWIYEPVTPDDNAIQRFLVGVRTLPRGHVNMSNIAFSGTRRQYWRRLNPSPNDWTAFAGAPEALGTSYYLSHSNAIVIIATAAGGGSAGGALTNDSAVGRTWEGTGTAVGGSSEAGAPNLTVFLNHARHEVGHAVGNHTFAGMAESGDDWAKTYGGWAASSAGAFQAAMWSASGTKTVDWTSTGGAAGVVTSAVSVRDWIMGMITGQAEPAGNAITLIPGTVPQKLAVVLAEWGAEQLVTYFRGVYLSAGRNLSAVQDTGYMFPSHTPAGAVVHHYSSRANPSGFTTYSTAAYNALRERCGWYSLASSPEMFAEIYTQKYSAGTLPPAVNGKDPAVFFSQLEAAADSGPLPRPPVPVTPPSPSPAGGSAEGTTPTGPGSGGSTPPGIG